ncbi:LacI family DNA-binding transcriptional regulator [Phycicoccus flavus]|uniref:LacI family DNA-binding transcriptional regulator n=1 Tax=Phycicoccus flavus TaxID=2502783 RepID=UPI000FEBBC3B|nr:LacI family DNA-binding transcriptional regulator [Phycicoccus flavus]NHA66458.1 LacI family transcriptional regulator [Phycicoccus flavus]
MTTVPHAPVEREKPATVHDVAALAGVSAQTVSRLLKGFDGIRPETRLRVETAIRELGYRPNRAAQLLRTRKSYRLGALVHEMFAYGPARLLQGATTAARQAGYSLSIVGVDGESAASVEAAFDTFQEEQVAGIIAVTLTDDVRAVVQHRSSEIPVIVDPAEAALDGTSHVEHDAALAAGHLLDLGHRRFGLLSGPLGWLPARQRRDGFLAAVHRAGASVEAVTEGDWSPESGEVAARRFAEAGVTAVFAANDAMAIGCMHGFRQLGCRVPEDVSVVGFDAIPESAYVAPGLTTILPAYEDEGRAAVATLIALIDGAPPPVLPDRAARLVHRGSTAPLP